MIFMYEGYQFLRNKKVWTTIRWIEPLVGNGEPSWVCEADDGEQSRLPVSTLALYPQVVSAPQFRGSEAVAGHPGLPGSRGRYTKGCRCEQCRAANAAYMKRKRKAN